MGDYQKPTQKMILEARKVILLQQYFQALENLQNIDTQIDAINTL